MTAPDAPTPAELPATYDAAATEPAIYARWQQAGVYTADAARTTRLGGDRDPFVVLMPPPNVTAVLHVGHGLNNTVQDVVTRWRRMAGDEALWLPGTDHAGIATQNVVEKLIAREEGRTRADLGRDAFVARTASFVEETGGAILEQLKAIGASCDWTRTRYTLSPELSRAVREAFVRLYERQLIYKGHRVIHWCPRCMTSLSDEEAEFSETAGKLYHVSYPLTDDPTRTITVATTRPETMLGDVAVAVHPEDERYRDIVGKTVTLPVVNRPIPVVADAYTDPAFGTGVVKITPAHDANDFEVGKRHGLPMPVVIDATGAMRDGADSDGRVPADLVGVDRFAAREAVVERLRAEGRLVKVEAHQHNVRHCYRCDTVVEPRLSDQWFVKMAPLAAPALEAVRTGATRILPERWEGVYVHWLENIRDWNISRQLWWGHRIPVFYCDACGWQGALREDPRDCPQCALDDSLRQDEDVLDTWFSSWLWPVSTMGWPDEESADLKAFFPSDVLVTAPEILFFWVARMIMAGYAFRDETAFHTVYLHGTVRDTQHRKMSKSLGNGIDPLEVVRLYGADALRWTAIAGLGMGADVILDHNDLEKSFAPGRNFCTKLWNIGRFLLANVGSDAVAPLASLDAARLTRADRWILARLDQAVADCDAALGPARPSAAGGVSAHGEARWREHEHTAGLRLNEYAEAARRFVWNELADWYLESTKARLSGGDAADREVARAVLVHALDHALRLLHPVVPFITEALWQRLPGRADGEFLTVAPWPRARGASAAGNGAADGAAEFELVRAAVSAIRQVRADYAVAPGKQVEAVLVSDDAATRAVFETEAALAGRLTRSTLTVAMAKPGGAAATQVIAGGAEVVVPLAGIVDLAKEREKLTKELADLEKQLAALRGRLSNEGFVSRAPAHVVEAERQKEAEWGRRRDQLASTLAAMGGA
ncbi:valine--tRNA ligase [Roseisolibacter sp. H3M3-2]|uniref:valine--tRNA ligase n=1 Tax=Roseisolibacter sp. H3M3-2 TaxID=3031323 RepID=UPI0023DB0079|nr:valine--tRNA ligase [Roseisolibacter sp. H3M3-2]MDF1502558.1 valine--tRNA ligase [Roseisolibacter sp. H3M3-2]